MGKLQVVMKQSTPAADKGANSRRRSTSAGQNSESSTKVEAVYLGSKVRAFSSDALHGSSASSSSLSNNRHGETDAVFGFSVLPSQRDDQVRIPNAGDDPLPRVAIVDAQWTHSIIYAFDHDSEISESRLKIMNTILGRCRTGLIFCAEYKGATYALKVRPRNQSMIRSEKIVLFQGSSYVKMKYLLQSDGKFCCLFDRIYGVPMESYIAEQYQKFTSNTLKFYFAEICAACAPITEAGLEFQDFKSSSFLITQTGHCCLLVSFFDVVEGGNAHSLWHAVGLFFLDLLSKSRVLDTSVTQETASLVSLAQQLTDADSAKRLKTFRKIKRHSAFDGVKWRKVGTLTPPLTYDGVSGGVEISDQIAATLVAPEAPNQLDGFTIVNTPGFHRV
jgi:hypothetical protein